VVRTDSNTRRARLTEGYKCLSHGTNRHLRASLINSHRSVESQKPILRVVAGRRKLCGSCAAILGLTPHGRHDRVNFRFYRLRYGGRLERLCRFQAPTLGITYCHTVHTKKRPTSPSRFVITLLHRCFRSVAESNPQATALRYKHHTCSRKLIRSTVSIIHLSPPYYLSHRQRKTNNIPQCPVI